MYASAVRSFGILGELAIWGHVGRQRSNDSRIQFDVNPLSQSTYSPPGGVVEPVGQCSSHNA
jgi:hypothetical protein